MGAEEGAGMDDDDVATSSMLASTAIFFLGAVVFGVVDVETDDVFLPPKRPVCGEHYFRV